MKGKELWLFAMVYVVCMLLGVTAVLLGLKFLVNVFSM